MMGICDQPSSQRELVVDRCIGTATHHALMNPGTDRISYPIFI